MPRPKRLSRELLAAALQGFQLQLAEVKRNIADVSGQLRAPGARPAPAGPATTTRRKRTMSAAARKRIGEAQRKRWAAVRRAGK